MTAASAAGDRAGTVAAAFKNDGELIGLKFRNVANMGAYLRPPEPAFPAADWTLASALRWDIS